MIQLCDMKRYYKHTTSRVYDFLFILVVCDMSFLSLGILSASIYTNQLHIIYNASTDRSFYSTWRLPCSSIWLPICCCAMLTGCMYLASAMYTGCMYLLYYANRAVEANKDKCRKGGAPEQRTLRFREPFCLLVLCLAGCT